ncbi:hypothetical protein ACFPOE_00075 [Caenimonas terrae]|uniref:DUF2569 family protein n=1 Tax=Caenimonas terrae TaxID=696074 RepID=A0ABW0N5H8_9BURK
MRALVVLGEFVAWCFAIWLFVGLVGALRWLAPGAEPGPDAWLALALKLAGLVVFVAAWALTARRGDSANQSADALT